MSLLTRVWSSQSPEKNICILSLLDIFSDQALASDVLFTVVLITKYANTLNKDSEHSLPAKHQLLACRV